MVPGIKEGIVAVVRFARLSAATRRAKVVCRTVILAEDNDEIKKMDYSLNRGWYFSFF